MHMPIRSILTLVAVSALAISAVSTAATERGLSPVIPGVCEYFPIHGAAVQPQPARIYRMIFDASQAAAKPDQLLPAIFNAAGELNALGASGVPVTHRRLAIVFHSNALPGILSNADYRTRYGVDNPNIRVLGQLRRAGVELYVCGQNLIDAKVGADHVLSDVKVATDALIVLATFQSNGYALLNF